MTKDAKEMTGKVKVVSKKMSPALMCIWNAADLLGQYSKILENIRTAAPVR